MEKQRLEKLNSLLDEIALKFPKTYAELLQVAHEESLEQ